MEGWKLPPCDLNITSLLTKLNFSGALQLAIPRCCNQAEQRTSSLIIRLLSANSLAFRGLPGKYCSADSKCSVIKGWGQETEIWNVSQGNLKILKSVRHKFTRETWEASHCITRLYYCKSFAYSIQKVILSPNIKRCIAQGPQPLPEVSSQAKHCDLLVFCNPEGTKDSIFCFLVHKPLMPL